MQIGPVLRTLAATLVIAFAALPACAGASVSPHFDVRGTVIVWGADNFGSAGGAPVVSDWIVDTNVIGPDVDLIPEDVHTVITGSLTPTTDGFSNSVGAPFRIVRPVGGGNINTDTNGNGAVDAADAFNAFGLRANTDVRTTRLEVQTSFYVASNTAYSMTVQASALPGTTLLDLSRIRLSMTSTLSGNDGLAFGSAAQFSHNGGANGGSLLNNRALSTLIIQQPAYIGTRKTARVRGTIADQSIRFDLAYRYNGTGVYDLSNGLFDIGAEVVYTVFVP